MNKIMLIGHLTTDPTLKYTPSGNAVCEFTIAVNRRYSKEREKEADFIRCVAWQKTGEFAANYFKKGQQMALEGRLQVRTYDGNDGQKHWVTEVIVEQIEFCGGRGNGSNSNNASGSAGGSGDDAPYQLGLGQEIVFDDNDLPF